MRIRIRFLATGVALLFFVAALHSPSSAHTEAPATAMDSGQSLEVGPENKKCAMFDCLDTDRDNTVSREELTHYGDPALEFDELDKNEDGASTLDEWNSRDDPAPAAS